MAPAKYEGQPIGSSPLARGLRRRPPHPRRGTRIIPARAGFTGVTARRLTGGGDHPRSRGVYGAGVVGGPVVAGSSPLARGLPSRLYHDARQARIIPARAGFTCGRCRHPWWRRDHPRSRGVYSRRPPRPSWTAGSSPLARGLPGPTSPTRPAPRIIPARAGFTHLTGTMPAWAGDHPRSRGVYAARSRSCGVRAGSSPLARGLPSRTAAPPTPPVDHPRSRGVYAEAARCGCGFLGSSPLARGLPMEETIMTATARIIPARAGFTHIGTVRVLSWRDHPRSRGVYSMMAAISPSIQGSSPLARGLRDLAGDVVGAVRIIPARAGFTLLRAIVLESLEDHPRSRGVYTTSPASPRGAPWIIPARAGFTP